MNLVIVIPTYNEADNIEAITAELLQNTTFATDRLEQATIGGFMTATDLADYLVRRDMPFREAHGVVGRVVALCQERDIELVDLTLTELQEFSSAIGSDIFDCSFNNLTDFEFFENFFFLFFYFFF